MDNTELDKTISRILKAQEELQRVKPGIDLSIQSYNVISQLISNSLLEMNLIKLRHMSYRQSE